MTILSKIVWAQIKFLVAFAHIHTHCLGLVLRVAWGKSMTHLPRQREQRSGEFAAVDWLGLRCSSGSNATSVGFFQRRIVCACHNKFAAHAVCRYKSGAAICNCIWRLRATICFLLRSSEICSASRFCGGRWFSCSTCRQAAAAGRRVRWIISRFDSGHTTSSTCIQQHPASSDCWPIPGHASRNVCRAEAAVETDNVAGRFEVTCHGEIDIEWRATQLHYMPFPLSLSLSSLSASPWSASCIMQMVRGQAKGYRKTYRQSFRILLSVQITFICTFWFPSCSLFQCNNFQPQGRTLTHTHTSAQAAQEARNGCGAQEAQLPGPPPATQSNIVRQTIV